MGPFSTLFDFPQFQAGLRAGMLAALVVAGLGLFVRRSPRGRRARPAGLAGPAFVLAALAALGGWWGLEGVVPLPGDLLWGLGLLVVGGEVAARARWPITVGLGAALPGAWLVAHSVTFPGPGWSRWLVLGVTVVGAALAADLDRRVALLGLGPVLLALSAGGIYSTVPDTELARAMVGAALPLALVGWPLRAARLGAGGAGAAIALMMWVAAIDGYGRPGSIVGAAGALGLLVTEPIGRRFGRRAVVGLARLASVGALEVAVVLAHFALVAYASRIAGFAEDGMPALILLVPALAGGIAVGVWFGISSRLRPRPWRQRQRPEQPPGSPPREPPHRPRRRRSRSAPPAVPGILPPHPN